MEFQVELIMSHSVTLIPLQKLWVTLYGARVEDERLFREAAFYLAVRCPGESEEKIKDKIPRLAKVAGRDVIDTVVSRALPGVWMTHQPIPPEQIDSPREGFQWFLLETQSAYWEGIKGSKSICVRVPLIFPEELELELYAIIPDSAEINEN